MSDRKVLSFDEYVDTPDVRETFVDTPRGQLHLRSVSSEDIIEWIEDNADKVKGKDAGLRLLVKCVVNPDGSRIPSDKQEAALAKLRKQDAFENGKLVNEAMVLNGLRAKLKDEEKNDSSATLTGDGRSAQHVH